MTEFITYIIVFTAVVYIVYRLYNNINKRKACDKCVLMDAAKKKEATILE